MTTIAQKVAEISRELPEPARPAGNYVPAARVGNLLFIAGQIGKAEGAAPSARAGAELSLDQARKAAEAAGLSVLAQIAASDQRQCVGRPPYRQARRLCRFDAGRGACVPEDSPARSVKDLQGKRISTEVVGLTTSFLARHGVEAIVELAE